MQDLWRLMELLFNQRGPDSRTVSPADMTGVITVLLGQEGGSSDSGDTDQLLRLLLSLLEQTEVNTPPSFINITAVLGDQEDRPDFTELLQVLELMMVRLNSSRPQTPGYINITGTIVDEQPDQMEDMQQIIAMLLARMSAMADQPSDPGSFNITLINQTPNQYDEVVSLLELIRLEIEAMESNTAPTGMLNISTVLVKETPRDMTRIQELLAMLMTQLTARTATPRAPSSINITLVQEDQDRFGEVSYLLELLMAQLRRQSVSQPQPGLVNISGVLVSPGSDDFGDMQSLLRLIWTQLNSSQTPDFPGYFNISGILVNGERTEMQSLRAMLEMIMSRMSAGVDMPAEELTAFRELVLRFFNRPSGRQPIDVQGILNMLIELGAHDSEPTFSIADFISLIRSLNVPEDHQPTFTDVIRRLMVLLQGGDRSPTFLAELTEVVARLLQLVETSSGAEDVSPEVLIRFIVGQTARPAGGGGPDGLEALLAALAGLLEDGAEPRRPPEDSIHVVLAPPPDSLPASLRELVLQLQLAAQQPRPLLQSLPQLLQLLELVSTSHSAPDLLQFVAQLAAAVLAQAPDASDRVLVPQILLQLRRPRPDRLNTAIVLLRRLLLLERQRRPTGTDGPEVSVTITSESDDTTTEPELVTLLRQLLDGGASTDALLDALLRTERDGGEARLAELLQRLVGPDSRQADTGKDAGFGGLSDLLGLLDGRSSTADGNTDFLSWLVELLGSGRQDETSQVSPDLISHLVHLLRRSDSRPDHHVPFVSPEEAVRLLLLLTGQDRTRNPGQDVSVTTLDVVLSLLDPGHMLRPTDTPAGLLRSLMVRVWGRGGPAGLGGPCQPVPPPAKFADKPACRAARLRAGAAARPAAAARRPSCRPADDGHD